MAALVGAMQLASVAQAIPGALVEGIWQTAEKSELTIAPCDAGYCGHISKIVVPDHIVAAYGEEVLASEDAFTDLNNKDPALRDRPIEGLQILTLRAGADPWRFEGEIYNPQDGNIYAGSVEVLGPDLLRLTGCVLYVLCQEQEWQRAPPPPEE
jgi:uncharacterized protein (DUF2147 family)